MSTLKRYFYIALTAIAPPLRTRMYDPCGAEVKLRGGRGWEYPCWSCNAPSKTGGYQPYQTRRDEQGHRRSLCERCYQRRRRWHWLTWLETGETVKVPEVDGDGYISPSTTRGNRTYRVYSLFGFQFVSATAARTGRDNSLNARYWFRQIQIEGSSRGVEKAKKAQGNVMILPLAEE